VPAAGHLVHMPAHIYMRTGGLPIGGHEQRARRGGRSPVHRDGRRERRLSGDVLQPQPRFPRVGRDDVGQFAEAKRAAGLVVTNTVPMIAEMGDARAVRREDPLRAPPVRAVGRGHAPASARPEARVAEHAVPLGRAVAQSARGT